MRRRILYLLAICFVSFYVTSAHGDTNSTVSSSANLIRYNSTSNAAEMAKIQEYTKRMMTTDGAYNLFTPLMQPSIKMNTFDGKMSFYADIACSTEATLIQVSALPSSSLTTTGELNISIAYDYDYDGRLDHMLVINNAAGACVNGAIVNCTPAGSWSNCQYGMMEFDQTGMMSLPTTLPSGENRPPHGLAGCFCFNASCGQNTLLKLEQILLTIGTGVLNQMRLKVPDLVVSKTKYDFESMSYSFYGTKSIHCSDTDSAAVKERTNMYGELFFPYQSELMAQEADKDSPWSLVKEHVILKSQEYTCTNRAAISFEQVYANEWVTLNFGIGNDSHGGTHQCYSFFGGSCGPSYFETSNHEYCWDWVVANRLADVCATAYLPSGYFTQIMDVRNLEIRSGWGNYIACYGSEENSTDRLASMECAGRKLSFMPTCMSPSMGVKGQILVNDPYDKEVFQGCYKVAPYQNGCEALEQRSDCRVVDRVRDGYYLVRNGILTSENPPKTCRIVTAPNRTVTICEPWWEERVIYECDQAVEQWEKEKQRAQAIGDGINFTNGQWLTQGDIGFNEDGSTYSKSILTELAFQNSSDLCVPACLVSQTYRSDQIYLPEQGKLEEDGKYHLELGESSYVSKGTISVPEVIECEPKNGKYVCPVGDGQTIQYDCTCSNASEFVAAIVSLSAISQASSDFICSTGEEHGQCISSTEESPSNYRVACYKDSEITDCLPFLWVANTIPPQTHFVQINSLYQCVVPGVNANDEEYPYSILKPLAEWFTPRLEWAKDKIRKYIADNSLDLNSLVGGNTCECAGFEHGIDICQGKADGSYQCITTNVAYDTEETCTAGCRGRATFTPELGLCIFKEPELGLESVGLAATYNMGLDVESEKVFGEVVFSGSLLDTIYQTDSFAYCDDKSFYDETTTSTQSANCTVHNSVQLVASTPTSSDITTNDYSHNFNSNSLGFQSVSYSVFYLWNRLEISYISGYYYQSGVRKNFQPLTKQSVPSVLTPSSLCTTQGLIIRSDYQPILRSHCLGKYLVQTGKTDINMYGFSENEDGSILFMFTFRYYRDSYTVQVSAYKIGSHCSVTGAVSYNGVASCTSDCKKSVMKCNSTGAVVTNPNECNQYDFRCMSTNLSYSAMSTCQSNCAMGTIQGFQACGGGTTTADHKFSYYLTPTPDPFGFDAVVSYVSDEGGEQEIGRIPYGHEETILNQCVSDYVDPYIDYDEPATNAHFEFSYADQKIFNVAAAAGLLPKAAGRDTLPLVPPVYSGSIARDLQIWDNRNNESIEMGDGPLTPDDRILQLMKNKAATAPRIPMFWEKEIAGTYNPDTTTRLGKYEINLSRLIPRVYYYECPDTLKTAGNTTACGPDGFFGGIAQTIAGPFCFKNLCDAEAATEETTEGLTGCGMVNDGRVQ